jgi:hypothetical protein
MHLGGIFTTVIKMSSRSFKMEFRLYDALIELYKISESVGIAVFKIGGPYGRICVNWQVFSR